MRPRTLPTWDVRAGPAPKRRGLTLIELMLGLTITVMVAGAMSGMMTAVSAGVSGRQDTRAVMVRSHAAGLKLGTYVNSSRAIWGKTDTSVCLWLNDTRQGECINATEIRWLVYDAVKKTVEVQFVRFPSEWSDLAKEISDIEYPKDLDEQAVYAKYAAEGIASLCLLEGVEDFSIKLDQNTPLQARRVVFSLTFDGPDGPFIVDVPTTITHHQSPVR